MISLVANKSHSNDLPFQPYLGEKIKDSRKVHGITQEQLAEKVELGPSFIRLLETGRKLPSLDSLAKSAEVLKVPAYHFLMDPSEVEPKKQTIQELLHLLNAHGLKAMRDSCSLFVGNMLRNILQERNRKNNNRRKL